MPLTRWWGYENRANWETPFVNLELIHTTPSQCYRSATVIKEYIVNFNQIQLYQFDSDPSNPPW